MTHDNGSCYVIRREPGIDPRYGLHDIERGGAYVAEDNACCHQQTCHCEPVKGGRGCFGSHNADRRLQEDCAT